MHTIKTLAFGLVTSLAVAFGLVAVAEPLPTDSAIATPNHDPHRLSTTQTAAAPLGAEIVGANAVTLRAEPEPAEPAKAFVAANNTIYAKPNARLRAAPNTASQVMTKLIANAQLRATARSADGTWWKVALADGSTGYVHRDAVTLTRPLETKSLATTKPLPVSTPGAAASPSYSSVLDRSRQSLLGYVDQAVKWVSDTAAHGTPRKIIRAER